DLPKAKSIVEGIASKLGTTAVRYDEDITKVSIVGLGMRSHAGVAARMFELLASEGINIQAISTSEIKISCLVATKYTELAVRTLHDGFGPGEARPKPSARDGVTEVGQSVIPWSRCRAGLTFLSARSTGGNYDGS